MGDVGDVKAMGQQAIKILRDDQVLKNLKKERQNMHRNTISVRSFHFTKICTRNFYNKKAILNRDGSLYIDNGYGTIIYATTARDLIFVLDH